MQFVMVQFLSIIFFFFDFFNFCWVFQKFPFFCVTLYYKTYWSAEIFYALSCPSVLDGGEKFHVPASLSSVKEASVRIWYGAGRGGLEEPVWALWIREKFGHTGCTSLALLIELSKAFINMEKLMSPTRVRKNPWFSNRKGFLDKLREYWHLNWGSASWRKLVA
jgi:hypothetical protein